MTSDAFRQIVTKALRPFRGIETIHATPKEQAALQQYAVAPMVGKYLLWRQAMIALLLPLTLAYWIWEAVDLDHDLKEQQEANRDNITAIASESLEKYSNFASSTTLAVSIISFICIALALYFSMHWRRSRAVLTIAFLLPFVTNFLLYLVPLVHFFEQDFDAALRVEVEALLQTQPVHIPSSTKEQIFHYADLIYRGYLTIFIIWECLQSLGPSAVCLLPALFRGGLIVKKILPGSPEAGWIMRAVPYFLAPLLGFVLFVLVQVSDSYYLTAIALIVLCAFLFPSFFFSASLVRAQPTLSAVEQDLVRGGATRFLLLAVTFALIVAFLVKDPAGQFVAQALTPAGIARFVLHFLITYNTLSVLSADWIVQFLVIVHLERKQAMDTTKEVFSSSIATIHDGMEAKSIPSKPQPGDDNDEPILNLNSL